MKNNEFYHVHTRFKKSKDNDIIEFLDKEKINKSQLIRAGLRMLIEKYCSSSYTEIKNDLFKNGYINIISDYKNTTHTIKHNTNK